MFYTSNTTITIFGDNTTFDEWGDEIDAEVIVDTGIPASITEIRQEAQSENTTVPLVITEATLRISSVYLFQRGGTLKQNCRIKDENTGITWIIMSIMAPQNAFGHFPYRIDLLRSY